MTSRSESSASRTKITGVSVLGRGERQRVEVATWGILLALAVAVVMLRFHRLSEVPPGLYVDEGAHGVDALQVLQGEHSVFFPPRSALGSDGREGMVIYAIVPSIALLGRTMLAIRLPTAIGSSLTIFVVFLLGRMLYGRDDDGNPTPWRGLLIGGVGAGLLAVSINQTIIGRMAFRANYLPLMLSLTVAFLWWGWKRRILWKIALAGLFAGLLLYTYVAARITPLFFACLGLSSLSYLVSDESAVAGQQKRISHLLSRLQADLPSILIFAGTAILVAAPLVFYFALHPQDFSSRINQLSFFRDGPLKFLSVLLINFWDHLRAFGFLGDPAWRRNFAAQPMLNIWTAFFFWSGLGIALWRRRKCSACRLLLLWLIVLILPAVLARDVVPHSIRMIGASPAVYLLAAFGVWEMFQLLLNRLQASDWYQKQTTQKSGREFHIAICTLIGALILVQGVTTYHTYFHKWTFSPKLYGEYEVEWSELTTYLNARPPSTETVFLIPDGQRHLNLQEVYRSHTFDYLYHGAAPAYLFHTALPNLAQEIESALVSVGEFTEVKVVEWDLIDVWSGDENDRFAFLLGKYGRYQGSESHGRFILHTYTDISLERPWTFYDHLKPMKVTYDGGIELQGFALNYDEERIPQKKLFNLGEARDAWVALQWYTVPDLATDFAISLRLYDSGGAGVYQQDAVLWKPNHNYTGDEGPAGQFDSLTHVELPVGLPSGVYELRLVVYDAESKKPTVELGTWAPETTLARLRLGKNQ